MLCEKLEGNFINVLKEMKLYHSESDTIEIDSDQSKRFEEEENHVSKLDGYKSNKNISIDTLMKIARAMQAQENAQE